MTLSINCFLRNRGLLCWCRRSCPKKKGKKAAWNAKEYYL